MHLDRTLRSRWQRYGFAFVGAVIALVLRAWCEPFLGGRLPFVTFFPAIVIVALLAGPGPGLGTLIFCLAGWHVLPISTDATSPAPLSPWTSSAMFVIAGVPLVAIGAYTRRVRLHQEASERTLILRSKEFEAAFEMSNAANVHLDPTSLTVLRANARFCSLSGLRQDQLPGFAPEQLFLPEERDRFTARIRRIAAGTDTNSAFQADITTAHGSVLHVDVALTPLPADDGTVRLIAMMIVDRSEQIASDRKLQESESLLRAVAQVMPQLVWSCDSRGQVSFVSECWTTVTGLPPAEALSHGWLAAIHPDDRRELFRRWGEASGSAESFCCPHRLRAADGEYRRFLSRALPLRRSGHQVTHWIGTSTDVEVLRATEDAVLRSEAMFRGLADANLIGVLIASPRGIEHINDEMLRIAGRSRDEANAATADWRQWLTPRPIEPISASGESAAPAHSSALEYQILRPDGSLCPVVGATAPLYAGSEVQIVVAQDLTDQKKGEEVLRAREAVYGAIGESIDFGIWTAGADGRCTYVSPSFLQLVGMSTEECAEFGWVRTLHPEDMEATLFAWQKCVQSGGAWDHEHRVRGADGKWHPILARGVAIRDQMGRVIGWAGINLDISKLKAAEQRLQESGALLGRVLDGLFTFVAVMLPDGTTIEANRAALDAAGISEPDVLGHKLWDTYWFSHSVEEQNRIKENCARAVAGTPSRYELVARMGAGAVRLLDFMLTPLRDEFGRVTHLVVSAIDITERKQAELDLLRANRVFTTLADATPDFIYRKDRDGRLIYANRTLTDAIGLGEFGAIGRTDVEFLDGHPSSFKIMETDQRIMATGQSEVLEESVRLPDGEHVYLSTKVAERDSNGRIIGLLGVSRDITDRKKIQQQLEESERRYRGFAESVPAMLWAADERGHIIDRNRHWEEFTGQAIEEGLGDGWKLCVHPDDLPRVEQAWGVAVATGSKYAIEYRMRRASDGAYRWHDVQAVASRDESGAVVGWFGTCADIQVRKEAEQVLSRDRETLERLVEDRTHELEQTHRQLRFAERMAFIGTLSTGLGHDIGNLLLPIRVRLNALARREMDEQMRADLEAIKASLDYLQRLANGLRLLAVDPQQGSGDETTNIDQWTGEVLPLLKNVLPGGVRLVAEFPDTPCEVKISRAALTQLAFNLVQNAGDAMRPRGSGTVRVSGRVDGEVFELKVSDDGPGMTEEVKRRCIEPFFSTKPRGVSTGLGLPLVFGLVKRARGTISFRSDLGSGTEFETRLPLASPRGRSTRTALVEVTDPRLRAFVRAELAALAYTVRSDPGDAESIDMHVCEHLPTDRSRSTAMVVISEPASAPIGPGVVVVGTHPSPRVIRETLRRLARETEDGGSLIE